MGISIVSVGKNKDRYIKEVSDEYCKRLSPFSKVDLVYLPDVPLTKSSNREIVVDKEGKIIENYLNERLKKSSKPLFLVTLDYKGTQYSSEDFAKIIEEKNSSLDLIFIIGGVYGLSQNILNRADLHLSLSKMTFTHQMTRIILLEQIYRSFTIINGKKYHY
ncbi:MAG: 23S rRNA (pseudouridine(1915)-N(3))-methyltransferase RlmH [Candidatus Cloacimonadia bacterium]